MGLSDFNQIPFSEMTLVGVEAAVKAAKVLKKGFGSSFSISSKRTPNDLVTEYDKKSETLIIEQLKKKYPKHSFLSEECGEIGENTDDVQWIIDPLDGTVNFAHGIPSFAISIGVKVKNDVEIGIIHHPLTEELFIAERGKGSFGNGKKLQVSSVTDVRRSFLATGFPYNVTENPHHCIESFIELIKMGVPIRRIGSAALDFSYVASGKFDGFFEASLAPWDVAAGKLIVELAGGKVSTWEGEKLHIDAYDSQLASNGLLHDTLVKILHDKYPKR